MKNLIIIISLFLSIAVSGQLTKTVKVNAPGNLLKMLSANEKSQVTNLVISGVIDARDFAFMRSMEKIETIDLFATSIRSYRGKGGTTYADSDSAEYQADEMPELAFSNMAENKPCVTLKKIILPQNTRFLGFGCFNSCSGLIRVDCPKSLSKIGEMAFQDWESLASFEFGENVDFIGSQAFLRCFNIESLTFNSDKIDGVDVTTFHYCKSLKSIYVNTLKVPIFLNLPVNVEKSVFESIIADVNNVTLFVKPGTRQLFRQDSNWNVFPIIVEL